MTKPLALAGQGSSADPNASAPSFQFQDALRYEESAQGYVLAKVLSWALGDPK